MFKGRYENFLNRFCTPTNKRYRCRSWASMSYQFFCNSRQVANSHYKAKCIYCCSKAFPMNARYFFSWILMTCYNRKGCSHSALCYRNTCISRGCNWRCYAWYEFKWYTSFPKGHRLFTTATEHEWVTAL